MRISIIIPSFDQDKYIVDTFENLKELKAASAIMGVELELLLFDSCSNEHVQAIIQKYMNLFDLVKIEKDKGQYDAINKGIEAVKGQYWTWLNTDDLIDVNGFKKVLQLLKENNTIEYIYGDLEIINESGNVVRTAKAPLLTLDRLLNVNPGINQPGSFFKTAFSKKLGLLGVYNCSFDYEYLLRFFKEKGKAYRCDFVVGKFRYHDQSKSGSKVAQFVKEQIHIRKLYGRRSISLLNFVFSLRTLKHKLINKGG